MHFPDRLDQLFPPDRWIAELESAFSEILNQSESWSYAELTAAGMDPAFMGRALNLAWTRFPVHSILATIRKQQTMEPEQLPEFLSGFRDLYLSNIRLNQVALLRLLSVQSRLETIFRLAPSLVFELFVFDGKDTIPHEGLQDFLPVLPDDFLIRDVLTAYLTQRRTTEYEKAKITNNIRKILATWWSNHPAEQPHRYLETVLHSVQAETIHRGIFSGFASHLPDAMLAERARRWAQHSDDEFLPVDLAVNVLTGTLVPNVETSVSMDFASEDPEEEMPAGISNAGQLTDVLTSAIRAEVEHRVNEREQAMRTQEPIVPAPVVNFSPSELPDLTPPIEEEPVSIIPIEEEMPNPVPEPEPPVAQPVVSDLPVPEPPKKSLFDLVTGDDSDSITSGSFIPIKKPDVKAVPGAPEPEPQPEITKEEAPKRSLFDIVTGDDDPVPDSAPSAVSHAVNLDQPTEKVSIPPIVQTDLFAAVQEGPVLPVLEQMITENQAKIFIRYLFRKDEQQFYQAIHDLNDLTTWQDARQYLDRIFKEFKVDLYSNEALEFTDIIFSRFN